MLHATRILSKLKGVFLYRLCSDIAMDRFRPIFRVNRGLPPLCLIVTGKTYPDRKLFLFGKKLQLRFKLLGVEMQGPTRDGFSRSGNSQSKQKARGNQGFHGGYLSLLTG